MLKRQAGSNDSTVLPMEQVDLHNNMSSTTAENELNEAPNAVDNSSDDAVPQEAVEEQVIADETVLLEESPIGRKYLRADTN